MSDASHRTDNYKSPIENRKLKWARQDSNLGPRDYESPALTAELQAHGALPREHSNIQRATSNFKGGCPAFLEIFPALEIIANNFKRSRI